ncbi:MAG: orotidine-5'-phosphate decarboxylase [Solirubrobacteraceae bacterium]
MADRAQTVEAAVGPQALGTRSGQSHRAGFGDRLAGCVQTRRSQIVLGLDPDPTRLWPEALEVAGIGTRPPRPSDPTHPSRVPHPTGAAERAARAVATHCRLVLDATAEQCVAVKPQVACFERLGAPGWAALHEVMRDAGQRGLIVIADAKRGDIDISARAYAQAFFGATQTPFGEVEGLGADALTVSPLLGRDSLAPLIETARERGAGLFALVRTSNPGAADIQDRELAAGGTVSEALARMVDELGAPGVGDAGLSDVGAVTGATAPERMEALRALMPHAVWLLPGIGAQGASGRDLAPAFAPGPAGGLVSASRAIVDAFDRGGTGGTPAACARNEAARLRELIWGLYA